MYYTWRFSSSPLALLGIAVSGVCVYLFPTVFTEARPVALRFVCGAHRPSGAVASGWTVRNPLSVELHGENAPRLLLLTHHRLPFFCLCFAVTLAIAGARATWPDLCLRPRWRGLGLPPDHSLIRATGGPGAVLVIGRVACIGGALLASSGPLHGMAKTSSCSGPLGL